MNKISVILRIGCEIDCHASITVFPLMKGNNNDKRY